MTDSAARDRRHPEQPLERMTRLERSMMRIRWFGVLLAIYQVHAYQPFPGTEVPGYMVPASDVAIGALAVTNLAVMLLLRRAPDANALRRIGMGAFLMDLAALWAFTIVFSFEEYGATWVTLMIGALEGALRYRLRGALAVVGAAIVIEPLREIWRAEVFGFGFFIDGITFRLGMLAIVGAVAGVMSRNLERERQAAEQHAVDLAALAEREAQARRESNAFQQVILAGVSAIGMRDALRSMIDHIATELGYDRITVLMLEDGRLHPVAARGFPGRVSGESIPLGEGVAGAVALSGVTEIVPDTAAEPRYYEVDPTTRSQITVPVRTASETLGVIDVESPEVNAFTAADASRLERLAHQMALVIENARLLAQERETVERLRELDTMKSDFVAIASHELRTPLTAMKGSIRTLMRPDVNPTPEEMEEFLAILNRQSDRLARLVEDLLIVSRLDAGGVSLQIEAADVNDVLREAVDDLGPWRHRISVAVPADIPAVITDGQRLIQIARNLIENAVKFSPQQTTVRVSAHQRGSQLVLEVADDGPGIPADQVEHVFDRFHQVGGSMRRRGEGFGLGLYITKRLVTALGGTIEVDTTLGRGTTFRVRVPVALEGEDEEAGGVA